MTTLAVVDCGMGNLHSVCAAASRACPNADIHLTDSAEDIAAAQKVILPGDGNFGACMREIDRRNLRAALVEAAQTKPFFGICVGMQALFAGSEESDAPGLAVFEDTVRRLPAADDSGEALKVPHIGWNTVTRAGAGKNTAPESSQHITAARDDTYFYFVHSYYAPVGDYTLLRCDYGAAFSAAVGKGQLIATQFHPEKSGADGIRLLESFLNNTDSDSEAK